MRLLTSAVAIVVLVAACASSGEDEIGGSAGEQRRPAVASSPSSSPSYGSPIPMEPGDRIGDRSANGGFPVVSPALVADVDQAIADLASRLGVDTPSVAVVVAHELTDGHDIYPYHGTVGRPPFLCESEVDRDTGPARNIIPPTTTP